MTDLVSVILPTRNHASLLVDQLTALSHQSYIGPWELVVVDNGSSDGTDDVIGSFSSSLPLRHVRAGVRRGASYARNAGAAAANGGFFLFIDDDDQVTSHWLETMISASRQWDIIRGNNHNYRFSRRGVERVAAGEYEGLVPFFRFLPSISTCNSGICRAAFEGHGGFDERFERYEDTEFYWRALLAGYRAAFISEAVLNYRLRSGFRAVFWQKFSDEKVAPLLYRTFRSVGMPRTTARSLVRTWLCLLRLVIHHPSEISLAEEFGRTFGHQLGRIFGSFRNVVVYL